VAAQVIDDFFRASPYAKKSKDNDTNAASVDDGHFGSVCTLHQE
jgi:hypothetical protein